ncbi:MAG: hypothetical protein OXT67_04375 [Zetaproteobacteria bacterium]|nr:hypothetical protein [Zetaproteobacteria bacterium]
MAIGTILSIPNPYSNFARIRDETGLTHTVGKADLPEDVDVGDEFAYKVEIWGNDSGIAYSLEEED